MSAVKGLPFGDTSEPNDCSSSHVQSTLSPDAESHDSPDHLKCLNRIWMIQDSLEFEAIVA